MESLMELLQLTLKIRACIESGESLRGGIQKFIEKNHSSFYSKIKECLFVYDQTGQNKASEYFQKHLSKTFFEILADGLQGLAIHERLVGFEDELHDQIDNEIQKKIDALPYLLMIPLLLLMFPAYLILILGPILNNFIQTM